jgi:transglutaminase-like putative cysteine protease
MSLERALQLHTAVLAALGVLLVGLGHDSPLVPGILALAIITAVVVTDIFQWLKVNRLIANLLAVVAVVWSLKDFFLMASDGQLLAIANMLGYLQVVLLFQEKSARIYWQLLVLSLLQVVVAAALDLGPEFGLLVCLYIVIGLSTLVLLCVHRAAHASAPAAGRTATRANARARQLLAPPEVLAMPPIDSDDWQLLPRGFFARQVALLTAVTFLFAVVFFYASPRLREGAWPGPRGRGSGLSGVAPQIKLAEAGRIHLSSQVAMRVALTRVQDKQSVPLAQDPYFHGAVLTEYVADENGYRWLPRKSLNLPPGGGPRSPSPPPMTLTSTNLVQQDIVLESSPSNLAYAIMPILESQSQSKYFGYSRFQHHLYRKENEHSPTSRQHRYTATTPAIRSGRQLHGVPHTNPLASERDREFLQYEREELTQFDAARFPRLAQTAAEAIERLELTAAGPLDKALALERHFRTSNQYEYSLNLDFVRNRDLDPLEDFVANHKRGHCEYFASALTLMLRSQGIPARIVIGYKGGLFNSLGHYYVVQQRFAHAWVEAWMPAGEVPDDEIAGRPSAGGCWYRLDPTPGRAVPLMASDDGIAHRVAQAFDYVELLWRDYVVSLNAARQQDALYEPLTARAAGLPSWIELRGLPRWLRRWTQRLGLDFQMQQGGGGRRFFEGSLALLVAAALLGLLVLAQVLRLAGRALVRRWQRWRDSTAGAAALAPGFYRRLEKLLARLPLRRQRGQTPRELAASAGVQLATSNEARPAAHLPAEIVAAYYRARFGGDRLDKTETDAIEQALATLAPAVSQAKKR